MLNDYKKLIEQAKNNSKENKKFFDKLKKQKPKGFDNEVNKLHDEVFEEIDCLKCANCCKTTGPLLLNKDIDRLASALKIKPSVFTNNYLTIDEDNDYVFKQMPCPFLGSNNYCNVYTNRPNACKQYPHTQQNNQIQKIKITFNNSLICPAVAKITEALKKIY